MPRIPVPFVTAARSPAGIICRRGEELVSPINQARDDAHEARKGIFDTWKSREQSTQVR